MAPPKFDDVSKDAKDLFSDDFDYEGVKVVLKSQTANKADFKVEAVRSNDSGAVSGFLETKFTHSSGLAFKEKWSTNNVVSADVTATDKLGAGTKLVTEATFSPNGGGLKDLKVKLDYKTDRTFNHITASANGGILSTVFGHGRYLFGGYAGYDANKGALSTTRFTVGYKESDIAVTSTIIDGDKVEGNVYHVPRRDLLTAVNFSWSRNSKDTTFAVVGKYYLDPVTFVKAKFDKELNIGLNYSQQLRRGVTLSLGAKIAGAQLGTDAHRLGLKLTFDATA